MADDSHQYNITVWWRHDNERQHAGTQELLFEINFIRYTDNTNTHLSSAPYVLRGYKPRSLK